MPIKTFTERVAEKVLDKATRQRRTESKALRAYQEVWYSTMAYVKLGKYPRRGRHEEHNPLWAWEPTMPEPVRADSNGYTDWVLVKMLPGQQPEEWAQKSQGLAHAFQAIRCRVKDYAPGFVLLEFLRADVLSQTIPAFPVKPKIDLTAIPVGLQEDGRAWTIRLKGSMILLGGSTNSGKSGILWGLVRGLLPGILDGTVRVYGCDPKHIELSRGRELFEMAGGYADDAEEIDKLLQGIVQEMKDRAVAFAAKKMRSHEPSKEFPAIIVFCDELAWAISYGPASEKKTRDSIMASLQVLCSQGRALGITVIGAAQDNRVETNKIRHLFNYRICLRVDSADQVDMLLGIGSRDLGALSDKISDIPETGAGVAYVREEGSPEIVRVRSSYVSDSDIDDMVSAIVTGGR